MRKDKERMLMIVPSAFLILAVLAKAYLLYLSPSEVAELTNYDIPVECQDVLGEVESVPISTDLEEILNETNFSSVLYERFEVEGVSGTLLAGETTSTEILTKINMKNTSLGKEMVRYDNMVPEPGYVVRQVQWDDGSVSYYWMYDDGKFLTEFNPASVTVLPKSRLFVYAEFNEGECSTEELNNLLTNLMKCYSDE